LDPQGLEVQQTNSNICDGKNRKEVDKIATLMYLFYWILLCSNWSMYNSRGLV